MQVVLALVVTLPLLFRVRFPLVVLFVEAAAFVALVGLASPHPVTAGNSGNWTSTLNRTVPILIEAAHGPGYNAGNLAREAIIGGTGAYAGVRGQGSDRELGNTRLAFHLELTR